MAKSLFYILLFLALITRYGRGQNMVAFLKKNSATNIMLRLPTLVKLTYFDSSSMSGQTIDCVLEAGSGDSLYFMYRGEQKFSFYFDNIINLRLRAGNAGCWQIGSAVVVGFYALELLIIGGIATVEWRLQNGRYSDRTPLFFLPLGLGMSYVEYKIMTSNYRNVNPRDWALYKK
jgi:hypothetical protein